MLEKLYHQPHPQNVIFHVTLPVFERFGVTNVQIKKIWLHQFFDKNYLEFLLHESFILQS